MNSLFFELTESIQNETVTSKRRLLKSKLRRFVEDKHASFWSVQHKNRWKEVMTEAYPIGVDINKIGEALFPVYTGHKAFLVRIRVSKSEEDAFSTHLEKVEHNCKAILQLMRTTMGQSEGVSVQLFVEPEFQECTLIPIEGNSFELAFAMALISFYDKQTIPPNYVFTGGLSSECQLCRIGHLPQKSQVLVEWRPKSWLISPVQCKEGLDNVVAYRDLSEVRSFIWRRDDNSWEASLRQLNEIRNDDARIVLGEKLLNQFQDLPDKEWQEGALFMIICTLISTYNHIGRAEDAMALIQKINEMRARVSIREILEQDEFAYILANCGTCFIDTFQFEDGLQFMNEFESEFPDCRHKIHYEGSVAKLKIGMGQREEALKIYQRNDHHRSFQKRKETARVLCDKGNLLRLMGCLTAAEKTLREALELDSRYDDPENSAKPFIRWNLAKVLAEQGRWAEVRQIDESFRDEKGLFWANTKLDHVASLNEIDELMNEVRKSVHDQSQLLPAFQLRAQVRFYLRQKEEIPLQVERDIRALNPNWASLTIDEIIRRIPY